MSPTQFKSVDADGVSIFYREVGPADAPVLLLLHGFPASSHMFRNLMPLLAQHYRVIAPDMPGFGFTELPAQRQYRYRFEDLSRTVAAFVDALALPRFALYVFDYGAPVGFRLAMAQPQRVSAIVSQNGKTTRWAYTHGLADPSQVAPEAYHLDAALMARPGQQDIQLDLFLDYASNVAAYPRFHAYFRAHQPPLLAIWGQHDALFVPAGAQAFVRDNPRATVQLLDAGHFALETHAAPVASAMLQFLNPILR
ncbi:MAG: hydrolase [Alphaproteobacteria bacterium PA3]|nr:MAG: hydrolase [Alphaproteobacteria bacterium PA3]